MIFATDNETSSKKGVFWSLNHVLEECKVQLYFKMPPLDFVYIN